jgi:hypothetical protein
MNLISIYHNLKLNNSISGNDLLKLILESKRNKNEDIEIILSSLNSETKILSENEFSFNNAYGKILNIKSNTNLRR